MENELFTNFQKPKKRTEKRTTRKMKKGNVWGDWLVPRTGIVAPSPDGDLLLLPLPKERNLR